jgi:hypothetical protein
MILQLPQIGRMRLIPPKSGNTGVSGDDLTVFVRSIALILLPFLAGCVCDAPVERLAMKTHRAAKKVALAAPARIAKPVDAPAATTAHAEPETGVSRTIVKPTLRIIHVKNCDCPEDFDPEVCGDRSAYTSWSPNCPRPEAAQPASARLPLTAKGSAQP